MPLDGGFDALAEKHGVVDEGGRQPPSFRDLMKVEPVHYLGRLTGEL